MKRILLPILMTLTLALSGCGKKLNIPGVNGPFFSTNPDHAVIDLEIENLATTGEIRVDIPKFGDSFVSLSDDAVKGTKVSFNFDFDALTNGNVGTLIPSSLPGGRQIPIINGKLPAVAFNIPAAKNVHVYLGSKVYGLFLPVSFPVPIGGILTYEIKAKDKHIGNAAVVGDDSNGENSGVLLLIDLNTLSKKNLKKIRRFQKKHGRIAL
jgi:hypothetical protein